MSNLCILLILWSAWKNEAACMQFSTYPSILKGSIIHSYSYFTDVVNTISDYIRVKGKGFKHVARHSQRGFDSPKDSPQWAELYLNYTYQWTLNNYSYCGAYSL